jgi:hypothetical protein
MSLKFGKYSGSFPLVSRACPPRIEARTELNFTFDDDKRCTIISIEIVEN